MLCSDLSRVDFRVVVVQFREPDVAWVLGLLCCGGGCRGEGFPGVGHSRFVFYGHTVLRLFSRFLALHP